MACGADKDSGGFVWLCVAGGGQVELARHHVLGGLMVGCLVLKG